MNVTTCLQLLLMVTVSVNGEEFFLNRDRTVRTSHYFAGRRKFSSTTESSVRVIPKPLVTNESSDDSQPDEQRLKFIIVPTERNRDYFEKKVKIHVYRGPNEMYTVLKNKPERKFFAPWGYFISQPLSTYKGQPNHEVSFQYS